MKLTAPVDIPKSETETNIYIRFVAAEKTPKSETVRARATKSVYKNPKKAETKFPTKRM